MVIILQPTKTKDCLIVDDDLEDLIITKKERNNIICQSFLILSVFINHLKIELLLMEMQTHVNVYEMNYSLIDHTIYEMISAKSFESIS